MEAQNLNCPNCGAAVSSDAPSCLYCGSKLATVACASCFGLMFIGSRHCPHCGSAFARPQDSQLSVLNCPRCRTEMSSVSIGSTLMRECGACAGLWLEVAAFERVCADREQQSAVLGTAMPAAAHPTRQVEANRVSYAPCPQCGQLMNRLNFARCSGVIVDVCKRHGTWFDRDELRQIVEFVRAGGMDIARQKEKFEIEAQREQLHQEQLAAAKRVESRSMFYSDDERLGGLYAARGLLKFFLE